MTSWHSSRISASWLAVSSCGMISALRTTRRALYIRRYHPDTALSINEPPAAAERRPLSSSYDLSANLLRLSCLLPGRAGLPDFLWRLGGEAGEVLAEELGQVLRLPVVLVRPGPGGARLQHGRRHVGALARYHHAE